MSERARLFFHDPRAYFCLLLTVCLLLSACSALSKPSTASQGEEPVENQDTSGRMVEGEDQGSSRSAEGDRERGGDDIPPVWAHCPAEPMKMTMFIHHTWNFSPNREIEMMSVDGSTGALASCPMTVHKNEVTLEDCLIPITNTGFIQTDAGLCDISASGFAVITLEGGHCRDGVITLTISEDLDPDAGYEGAMNCPERSQPYIPYYPPSLTTRDFPLQVGGMSAAETADPDLSMQFQYSKEWTLISEELSLPVGEE